MVSMALKNAYFVRWDSKAIGSSLELPHFSKPDITVAVLNRAKLSDLPSLALSKRESWLRNSR